MTKTGVLKVTFFLLFLLRVGLILLSKFGETGESCSGLLFCNPGYDLVAIVWGLLGLRNY